MSVSKLGEFFHKLGTEESIGSNSKRQSEDFTNSKQLQIHSKQEEPQKEEKSKNLVINSPNIAHRRNSKLIEKKPSQVNIIYEEIEQSEEKTPIKSPYINSAELPFKRKLGSKKTSYIGNANNTNQLKEHEERKTSRKNSHQIQNTFLFDEIQKLVKDSNMLSSQNFDLSSNSSGGEEETRIKNNNPITFPLKKEKDLFLSIPNKIKKKENKELTSPMAPAFTAIKKVERNFSVNAEAANNLLTKIIENEKMKKAKNSMSKMNILKMIALIYAEKVTNSQNNLNNPLHVLIYDMFLNKYGLKKIAENKYKQVINSFYLFLFQ